jgi:hypothetical protein
MGGAAERCQGNQRVRVIRSFECRHEKTAWSSKDSNPSRQARPPQGVSRGTETNVAGAEEAVGGQTQGRLSGSRPGTKRRYGMNPDEVAKLVLDIERSVQMRTMLRQKLATNHEVDLVEEWNEIEQLDLGIARKIRKGPIE